MAVLTLAFVVIALALGVFSSLLFVWQWTGGEVSGASSLILLIAVAGLSLKAFSVLKRSVPRSPVSFRRWIPFGAALAYAGYWMFRHAEAVPHGGWDAWAVWNLHARFLYRAAGGWTDLFGPALGWSQNHYPMLLPGLVNGGWKAAGSDGQAIPALIAALFAVLATGIVCGGVSAVSGDRRGWLAGLILLATPSFLLYSSAQIADVPLSVYILATIALLRFAEIWPDAKAAVLPLAGLSAGFAAWTKMEGLVFVLAVLVFRAVSVLLPPGEGGPKSRMRALTENGKDTLRLAIGLAPALILVLAFKAFLAPPADLQIDDAAIGRMTTAARYLQVARGFAEGAVGFGKAFGGLNPALLLGMFLLFFGAPKNISPGLLLLPVVMLGCYFMVYVVTPYDLAWHMRTSLDRLLLQLWPASLFLLCASPASGYAHEQFSS